MPDLSGPLSDKELERLDDFLLERVDEERDDDPGFNCGIINVGELDGFLTAIVSGPVLVPPSAWLPAVWGDEEPVWSSMEEFQSVFSLIMRHMNSIAGMLQFDRAHFEPLFAERRVKGKTQLIVDEWCCGYMDAIRLNPAAWQLGDEAVKQMLAPIDTYGTEHGWDRLEKMSETEAVSLRDAIPEAARKLYVHWQGRRDPAPKTVRHAAARVGRNDPCPCGSGKKYKRCCLQ
jgi:uncharacterized protein